jgi:hypothetical protein
MLPAGSGIIIEFQFLEGAAQEAFAALDQQPPLQQDGKVLQPGEHKSLQKHSNPA